MSSEKTDAQILSIAREILASDGLGAVSFDEIGRRLGRSKQAVLYWYPTKRDLLNALFIPWLAAEAEAVEESVIGSESGDGAISSFVRAVAAFHFHDLDRFRMMYLIPQTIKQKPGNPGGVVSGEAVYEVTNRLYGALERHLEGGPEEARRKAVAMHSAVLGVVLMVALADALSDPLKHSEAALVDALINSLTTKT